MLPTLVMDAFETLAAGDGRVIEVTGVPRFGAGDDIDIIIDETPLRHAMIEYGTRIFWLSALISSEEITSELQSLMRISSAVFFLIKIHIILYITFLCYI